MRYVTDINELDTTATYSYADYLNWRLEGYVELLRGKIARMSPAPNADHQEITGNIFFHLKAFLRRKSCKVFMAPYDVRLPKKTGETEDTVIYTVVQPDVCIVCDPAKRDIRGCIGAPDTIIEVLSPGNLNRDIKEKLSLYEEHGVPEYWIVAPGEKTVAVYVLENGSYQLDAEYDNPGPIPVKSLPGFSLEWEEVFFD